MDKRKAVLVGIAVLFLLILLAHGRISQNLSYHFFADRRNILGIPNFFDVVSNFLFVIIGFLGLSFCRRNIKRINIIEISLFFGLLFTGLGSAYYHYLPNNDTLIWDRLPMTLVFMSYLALLVNTHIFERKTVLLFYSLLVFGLLSILYWHISSLYGQDDLRLYVLVQFYPIVAIPCIFILYPSSRNGLKDVLLTFAFYLGAKFFEATDAPVFNLLGISGHSLKHVSAGIACWYIYRYVVFITENDNQNTIAQS